MDLFGGAKKTTKSKKTKKTSDVKKTTKTTKSAKTSDAKKTKKSSTTTRSKSKAKGGNFLGAIGDLVAPTGWGPFATAAGLLALDRADAALRRGTKEKKEKMKGGNCEEMVGEYIYQKYIPIIRPGKVNNKNILNAYNTLKGNTVNNPKYLLGDHMIDFTGEIICQGEKSFKVSIKIYCGEDSKEIEYTSDDKFNNFDSFNEAKNWLAQRKNQLALINLALLKNYEICKNPKYKTAFNLRKEAEVSSKKTPNS
jgi:hypothetical protein